MIAKYDVINIVTISLEHTSHESKEIQDCGFRGRDKTMSHVIF